jgi:putative membrane protein
MEGKGIIRNYNPYRFLIILYTVGLAGHIFFYTRYYMLLLTPIVLMISYMTVFIPFIQNREWKKIYFFVIFGIIAYIAEVIGVNSGIIFGDYIYGDILGLKIFGVPLIISLNWMVILMGSISLSELISKNKIAVVMFAIMFTVIFDYIMEPVAIFLKYWKWKNNHVPLTNYITWGMIAFICSFFFKLFNLTIKNSIPAFLFVVQFVYFAFLSIAILSGILAK